MGDGLLRGHAHRLRGRGGIGAQRGDRGRAGDLAPVLCRTAGPAADPGRGDRGTPREGAHRDQPLLSRWAHAQGDREGAGGHRVARLPGPHQGGAAASGQIAGRTRTQRPFANLRVAPQEPDRAVPSRAEGRPLGGPRDRPARLGRGHPEHSEGRLCHAETAQPRPRSGLRPIRGFPSAQAGRRERLHRCPSTARSARRS